MKNKDILGFNFIKMVIFLTVLFVFLGSLVDVYPKERMIKNETKYWKQLDTVFSDLVNYQKQYKTYPKGDVEGVCKLLGKTEKYCFSGDYRSLNHDSNFILGRHVQSQLKGQINLSQWCTNDEKFYYQTGSGCISDEALSKALSSSY